MSFTKELRMKPEKKSQLLLGVARSKAKMLEYRVPKIHDIKIHQDPAKLFTLSIGLLGDIAAAINMAGQDFDSFSELKTNLLFSARFFDSYLQSKLNETLDPYLILLGSASYYLCDLPGSASVLANLDNGNCTDLDGGGLEDLLLWLLQSNMKTYSNVVNKSYGVLISKITRSILQFSQNGIGEQHILDLAIKLRDAVYKFGTPRQLLFGDIIAAVLRTKLKNSTWNALPLYSGLPRNKWFQVLQKGSFIKELWPAQHLLGKADVLKGASAIVQMPTSAGKTKATELILRSAFLADRIILAIIIAPFRALCHEIKNSLAESFHNENIKVDELSDVLQIDFEIAEFLGKQQILVVTPEKLLYVLRHAPELATHVGLLIFDEGHQFDNGTRGITYELLLTSLRSMIPKGAQKVLISAVISNAEAVGEWLNGEPNVVKGTTLIPTLRSIGFISWIDKLGRIKYVDSHDIEQEEFFVPKVIEQLELRKNNGERTIRLFPDKSDENAIALYLGLKLVPNGGVAIFCGTKLASASICEKAVDIINRGALLTLPSHFSDAQEVKRLTNLHNENLGANAPASQSASLGIFSHHGNTPHGIRLAVEHAMRDNLIRFVVCTSTLAQGVNLPIRYLIIPSLNQGQERIKVRDFHNLMGRAGRAGMHTEGSILFANPIIYDNRKFWKDKWRWEQVKKLLEASNSEPCISNLLSIFDPLKSDDEKLNHPMGALDFAKAYIHKPDGVSKLVESIITTKGFSQAGINRQITWRINLICAVESFLLSHWDESENGLLDADVIRLAEETLAFFLADKQKKKNIHELFEILARNISVSVTDPERRKIYGRTLYGIQDAQSIERWVQYNADRLLSSVNETEIMDHIWPLFIQHINGGIFSKFDKPDVLKEIAHEWISGKPFSDLLKIIYKRQARMLWGATSKRDFKIDHVVDICEGVLAYDCALVVSAVCEFIGVFRQECSIELSDRLQFFQKRLKYGLPSETTIALYELGFSDRVIAQDIATSLNLIAIQKKELLMVLKKERYRVRAVMEKYPNYFQVRMNVILDENF